MGVDNMDGIRDVGGIWDRDMGGECMGCDGGGWGGLLPAWDILQPAFPSTDWPIIVLVNYSSNLLTMENNKFWPISD